MESFTLDEEDISTTDRIAKQQIDKNETIMSSTIAANTVSDKTQPPPPPIDLVSMMMTRSIRKNKDGKYFVILWILGCNFRFSFSVAPKIEICDDNGKNKSSSSCRRKNVQNFSGKFFLFCLRECLQKFF